MMADGADDGYALVQLHDQPFDTATMNNDVFCFLLRIIELYHKGEVVNTFSYTKFMLDSLKEPITVPSTSAHTSMKTVGSRCGVGEDIIANCLQRMAKWVKLSIYVVQAEYPSFEIVQCFTVFEISLRCGGPEQECLTKKIEHVANVCRVPALSFANQRADLLPVARLHKESTVETHFQCWVHACHRFESAKPDFRKRHPTYAFRPPLRRYGVFKPWTAEVESNFGVIKGVLRETRLNSLESTEEDVVKVILDLPESGDQTERAATFEEARCVWRENYGIARQNPTHARIDTGQKRGPRSSCGEKLTYTEFRRKRRDSASAIVTDDVQTCGQATIDAVANSEMEGWTEKHEKEKQFQENKLRARACEAIWYGQTTAAAVDPLDETLEADATAHANNQGKLAAAAQRRHYRVAESLKQGAKLSLAGKRYYIEPELAKDDVLQHLRDLVRIETVLPIGPYPDIAIVDDPANIAELIDVSIKLRGGCATLPEVIIGTRSGPVTAFLKPLARSLWISDGFVTANVDFARLLVHVLRGASEPWTFITSAADFEVAKKEAIRKKQSASVIGLCTTEECYVFGLQGLHALRRAKPNYPTSIKHRVND